MSFKQKLSKLSGIKKELLPSSCQIVGNILLIKFMKIKSKKQKEKIAQAIMQMFPYIKTICEIKQISGELREPKIIKLLGNGTETIHKEHKILYKIDVSKIMFSKGNLNERKRLVEKIKNNETIVDMFAGIGYFSLGIAKFSKAKKIFAIEKNPIAFNYLKENIKLNNIKNIETILADCRKISIEEKPDRIIMGYFPNTEKFLPYALKMSKVGTIIHFHNTYRKNELWDKPIKEIENACKEMNLNFNILEKIKVKSFAPNVYHVVVDFQII
ncbi:MAG: class I SAM-dependent methyltransferase family protein [Candidatus Aenigmatarchaeota archaeon]